MAPTPPPSQAPSAADALTSLFRFGDHVMLGALLVCAAATVVFGHHFGQLGLALTGALALSAAGVAVVMLARGTLLSRLTLAALMMGMTALQIQVARGMLEFHFGVFVTLAILLIYRDWRPIVMAAGVIAVHHLLFDRLQAAGAGVYCLTEPELWRVLLHASYVVVQTGFEAFMATKMMQDSRAGFEMAQLVDHLGRGSTLALDVEHVQARTTLGRSLRDALLRLNNAMVTVSQSAANIHAASTEVATGNQDLSQRTEATSSNLQRTSGSMAQIMATVSGNTRAAQTASGLASDAVAAARSGGTLMDQVVANMGDINEASRKIGDIIGVIDGIAFQTNILALNAAVEAARAGEHGRGFAVVASEVRSLAQRSATAAREIKTLVSHSVERVTLGSDLVQTAGSKMGEIVGGIQRVSEVIVTISHSAAEQDAGIGQVTQSIGALDDMTQQNAALVEESAAAAQSLLDQATQLSAVIDTFRLSTTAR